ncbi:S-formylglutathione hydrolase FrmB [Williamsia limnetica]|uniref:S-formylglutathione hydrolase FrmB n=1 Tax=Williamsia limnetica TaxID=882452 RepID=A0A318RB96_WILLI|nr:alpha/beta hydrolase family protein [Williamsia limnetica]PYE12317.1 S-formylglutathione hydrolase FrmB [Williamsia limnetica]
MGRKVGIGRRLGLIAAAVAVSLAGWPGVVAAGPAAASVERVDVVGPQRHDLSIKSPAMGHQVRITVLFPRTSQPRGSLYLLDGGGRKTGISDWINEAGAEGYFSDKDVNVVLPAGQGAFYTDWERVDPAFGRPQWETFLTVELPPLIDKLYNGNGNNAIAGLSMGGQAAYTLATRNPDRYTGVGSVSGCPLTTGVQNEAQIRAVVARDGGDAANMWGSWGSAGWVDHDPARRLDALRGKNIFIGAGSGVPGPLDQKTRLDPGRSRLEKIATGSVLEIGARECSEEFADLMRADGLQPFEHFRRIGTHAWPYWAEDLEVMYPVLARGL